MSNPSGQRGPFAAILDAADGFGRALRTARQGAGMSQQQMGEAAGFDSTAISRIEQGQRLPRRETAIALADALGLSRVERVMFLAEAGFIEGPLDEYTARIVADTLVIVRDARQQEAA